ncbi:MAG: hypothetical protein BWZ10_00322 [candidate division BRC1 bacterium ADurb.BinA364]|nr:MAG: hypothetical protein BWZ10_00322 [candidate division BRC1 bacterium ADurb.BinA364]
MATIRKARACAKARNVSPGGRRHLALSPAGLIHAIPARAWNRIGENGRLANKELFINKASLGWRGRAERSGRRLPAIHGIDGFGRPP